VGSLTTLVAKGAWAGRDAGGLIGLEGGALASLRMSLDAAQTPRI